MGLEGFTESIYFHFFSISAMVPCIFMIFAGISLLAIRRRSRATLHLGLAYLFLGLFMGSYAFAASIYHPAAAYHRWISVGALTLCATNFFLFLLHYPDKRRAPNAKTITVVFHVVAISLTAAFIAGTMGTESFFDIEGHHFDFKSGTLDIPIAIAILFLLILMVVTGVVRATFMKGTLRRALLAITLITFIAIIAPGAANLLSRYDVIDRGSFQYIRDTCVMAGFFVVFLVHLNTTVDRTSLMTRIMGISLATFLIVLQGLSFVSLSDMEDFYDSIRRRDLAMAVLTGQRPPGLTYLLAYSPRDGTLMTLVSPVMRPAGGAGFVHSEELFNTAMREVITSIPLRGNPGIAPHLREILKTKHRHFNGYAGAIEWIAERLPETESECPGALASRIDDLDDRVGTLASTIAHLPRAGFRENLRSHLEMLDGEMVPFRKAILESTDNESVDCDLLRSEALRYMAPMPPAGVRRYRILSPRLGNVTSFSYFDPQRHLLYEAGFDYRLYRAHQHPTAMKFALLTIVLVVAVLGGFQLFFMGAFIGPVRRIIHAIHRVRRGKFDTVIPLMRRDELGYISHNLNEMMSALDVSKEALSEYAENLSVMVTERTEDLARARDELWGEMQIARKMQTIMIPREPVMRGYEITGYMLPAATMGGDYYDVINTANNDWVIIGDVAGHGVPASLIMMMAHTSIRTLLGRGERMTPSELMERVNDVIIESVRQIGDDRYMTATVMAFNGNGKCTFTGLHQDIIIYRAESDAIETVKTEGIWLGIHDDVRGLVTEKTLTIRKDDIMFLYTDGITEAWKEGSIRNLRDPQTDMYGIDRLLRVFYESRALRPTEIRDAVLESLGGYDCTDDITMVILRKL